MVIGCTRSPKVAVITVQFSTGQMKSAGKTASGDGEAEVSADDVVSTGGVIGMPELDGATFCAMSVGCVSDVSARIANAVQTQTTIITPAAMLSFDRFFFFIIITILSSRIFLLKYE